jgi:hypothetical protein
MTELRELIKETNKTNNETLYSATETPIQKIHSRSWWRGIYYAHKRPRRNLYKTNADWRDMLGVRYYADHDNRQTSTHHPPRAPTKFIRTLKSCVACSFSPKTDLTQTLSVIHLNTKSKEID